MNNLERFKKDLDRLIKNGGDLLNAMQYECYPDKFMEEAKKVLKRNYKKILKELPSFVGKYQDWYSEALVLIKTLLPDRLDDFKKLYEKPKSKKGIKDVSYESYVIEDYLQSLTVTDGFGEKKVEPRAAIPRFQSQLNILKSARGRFESSLYDIKSIVQADIFDSELDSATELNKKGFVRGAGAIAGVVLEKHLSQVCNNHNVKIAKKEPSINDYNQELKNSNFIETHDWRYIQHLGDLRNLCDHDKKKEPTKEQVEELISGIAKIIKTLF